MYVFCGSLNILMSEDCQILVRFATRHFCPFYSAILEMLSDAQVVLISAWLPSNPENRLHSLPVSLTPTFKLAYWLRRLDWKWYPKKKAVLAV